MRFKRERSLLAEVLRRRREAGEECVRRRVLKRQLRRSLRLARDLMRRSTKKGGRVSDGRLSARGRHRPAGALPSCCCCVVGQRQSVVQFLAPSGRTIECLPLFHPLVLSGRPTSTPSLFYLSGKTAAAQTHAPSAATPCLISALGNTRDQKREKPPKTTSLDQDSTSSTLLLPSLPSIRTPQHGQG